MNMELAQDILGSSSGNLIDGYFKAPMTGNYRFYMACDDTCRLSFSTDNLDPLTATTRLEYNSHTSYRDYFNTELDRRTEWFALVEGNYYYMKTEHIQNTGGDHLTVSVEIENPNVSNHPNSIREI